MFADDLPTDIRAYHRRTRHASGRYALGPAFLDWDAQPDGFRRFEGARLIPLPLRLEAETPPFGSLAEAPPQPVTMATLGLFWELAFGLSAWKAVDGSCWPLRNNPSSGNLHPTEAWSILPALDGLSDAPGLYHYAPRAHGLEERRRYDAPPAFLPEGGFLLALSSVLWREAWKYGERAFRYCQLDVGHGVGAAAYAAGCLGWRLRILTQPGDATLAATLGLDREDSAHRYEPEHPDLIALVGPAAVLAGEAEPDVTPGDGAWFGQANRLSADHDPWPAVDRAARFTWRADGAGRRGAAPGAGSDPTSGARTAPLIDRCEPAGAVIRRRRSAQRMRKGGGVDRATFHRLLAATAPSTTTALVWGAFPWSPRLALILFVHQVEGLAPGLYALIRDPSALASLQAALDPSFDWAPVADAPAPLYRLATRPVRKEAAALSCLQAIAGHGAFSLCMLADFERCLTEEGDWAYRRLHWEAGLIGQALYLEATAVGASGTGIGCFFDDELLAALGAATDAGAAWRPVYHFTVGEALEDPRVLTLPAYPPSL